MTCVKNPNLEVLECGSIVSPSERWTSEELQVCEDCWWNELDGEERREIAQEANQ